MFRPHVTARRHRTAIRDRCQGSVVVLRSISGRVAVTICECCGELRVLIEGRQVLGRPGPITVDGYRKACHDASALVAAGDREAAEELQELGC